MFNLLSGVKCHICGMAQENPNYARGQHGEILYWADPKLCKDTDVRLDFCSVHHSAEWYGKQIEARRIAAQGDKDQSAG